ncbi:MAG: B12-binding domain-containing radical SAM protein [Thermoplasmatales archaeon]|nr:MAG: B12-binding domain-containing radical SAM protein [Thermoplasmatales archaeon]
MKIVLSADRTLMSNYSNMNFLGFSACAPKFLPKIFYEKIFCPPLKKDKDGQLLTAHCGQRKIQAALLQNGISEKDIAIASPLELSEFIDQETKAICITTHDPLGKGPASSTFSDLGGREPYTSFYFRKLVSDPSIKKHNVKVIVGGSGAWQIADENIMSKYGIDCVVIGEGEITAVDLINKVLNSESLPKIVQGEVVPLDQIPLILKPTINGIIEIARGCGRGCGFCNPTMLNFRCLPLDFIKKEAIINKQAGNIITLHAEDVLRYQADGFIPNEKAVLTLFTEMKKITGEIGISHFAYSSVAAKPKLIEQISEIMEVGSKKCPFISGQVGIETGSPMLINKYMKGKVKPFKPNEWTDIIVQGNKLLADNNWIPVETLIMGLPGETSADVRKTIDLLDDLAQYKSLIVPLFFVPIGNLKRYGFFNKYQCLAEHWELLAQSIRHTVKWSYRIIEDDTIKEIDGIKKWMIKRIIKIMEWRMNPYLKLMEEGISPLRKKDLKKSSVILENT